MCGRVSNIFRQFSTNKFSHSQKENCGKYTATGTGYFHNDWQKLMQFRQKYMKIFHQT